MVEVERLEKCIVTIKTYRSEALTAVHEMMEGLHKAGTIDKQTMREFDDACLTPAAAAEPPRLCE